MLNNSGINRAFLLGYIDKQPRWHMINDVQMLCFPVVTCENINKNGDKLEHQEWHQVKVPSSALEMTNLLKKGDMIYIQGKVQTRQYVDEQNIKRYKTEIVANCIQLLTPASVDVSAHDLSAHIE